MAGEKSEKATPKRRSDERKKGNVFQSKDAISVAALVANFTALSVLFPHVRTSLVSLLNRFFHDISRYDALTIEQMSSLWMSAALTFALVALPLLLVSLLINIVASGAQTKFNFAFDSIKFKLERINIMKGFGKLFSLRSIVELIKSVVKIVMLGTILYMVLIDRFHSIPKMLDMEFKESLGYLGSTIMSIVYSVGAVFVFLAAADYAYQWYEHEKNLKMSKQDIKEEYKQLEGDPVIKGKIKERQRMMAQRRMMQEVPKADVIIRNPTHYAIAIKYELGKHMAPMVIAKGMDDIALKIIDVASKHDIVTVENKPLARGLYEGVELNQPIPEEFYHGVAEVLAFVYQMKEKGVK